MKAIIIEDEELIASELQSKIESVADDVDIIEVLPSLKTARKWFLQHPEPDLIFMDIQLSDGVSFELFDLYTITCPVIFTTAYDEYAIRAFKVNSVDYLLKPINSDSLKRAIEKSRTIRFEGKPTGDMAALLSSLSQISGAKPLYKERFLVNMRNQFIPIPTNEIAFFIKDVLHYIYLFSGDRYIVDCDSMEEIEEVVDPSRFYRANRQYIVNIDAIKSARTKENSKLTIYLKEPLQKFEIDMSREKVPSFKKWLDR
ncbi:MAG TPA: LytTR family DNA-binding domain-containing protein [Flavisolibacter sp.]|jgi:DNA-binding LytR/AlgR family response regulator|nr:LytTR family DNA-binding domain-containing protein [Flavisolibacter sp.]